MKEWFKYEFGYINIDSDHLFLTNSGNWSETINMIEKSNNNSNINGNKSFLTTGFIILVFCLFIFIIYKSVSTGNLRIGLILLVIFGGYKFYDYLKTEIGDKFKIPLEKITDIKILEKSVEIEFIDGDGLKENYLLENIEEKGKNIMINYKSKVEQNKKL